MDRLHLKRWSMDLDDEAFARALATVGLLLADNTVRPQEVPRHVAAGNAGGHGARFQWQLPKGDVAGVISARDAATRWSKIRSENANPIRLTLVDAPAPELAIWSRWLGRITEIDGLCIAPQPAFNGRSEWRLPFTVATLASDAVALPLRDQRSVDPENWPFRFVTAGRANDRCEILVLSLPIAAALAAVLQSGLRLRATLVTVAGLGGDSMESAWPLVIAIAARVSASGVAIVPRGDAQRLADQVNAMCFDLTHNFPIDAALLRNFGRDTQLFGNCELIDASQVSAQVEKLGERVQALATDAAFALSGKSRALLTHRALPSPSPRAGEGALRDAMATSAPTFAFAHESGEAGAMTELAEVVRVANAKAVTATRSARFIQQRSFRSDPSAASSELKEIHDTFALGEAVLTRIRIGDVADAAWVSSNVAFPDHQLPPNETGHRLQVMFFEPRQFDKPIVADIHLPVLGVSTEAEFLFTPNLAGAFEARITIVHRGRILQTALMQTRVLAKRGVRKSSTQKITLRDEALIRRDWTALDKRPSFQLAMVCNHDAQQTPRMTALADKRAWAKDLTAIDEVVKAINVELSAVASNVLDYADGMDKGENPKLLVNLAGLGTELFRSLIEDQIEKNTVGGLNVSLDAITHIQIVSTRSDAVVPIEFVYDYGMPDDTIATVCPDFRKGLRSGSCKKTCPGRTDPAKHVCPMGFWGIRKVIERHVFASTQENPDNAALIVQSEVSAERDTLNILDNAVVGYSNRVKPASVKALLKAMRASVKGKVVEVKTWDDWSVAVQTHSPQLLVAFPHHDGINLNAKLEIGNQAMSTLRLLTYGKPTKTAGGVPIPIHVRMPNAAPPMVLLLGCDVAGTAQQFGNHVRNFRMAGAAIVLSTIATVFGEHAVAVGTSMVKKLVNQKGRTADNDQFGEILRDAKRQALLDSLPMALCVVAYGDADWKL